MPEEVVQPVAEETTTPVTEEVTPKPAELTAEQQRAFDKRLGKELAKLRREHDERLLEAIKSLKPEAKEAPAKEDSEPKEEDFADFKEFTRALARWEIRQERKAEEKRQQESKAKEEQTTQTEERNQLVAEHNERLEDARDKYEDFDAVIASAKDIKITPWIQDAIIESEDGPELMYYLAQHPEDAEKLADMRPASALRQLERIAAKVSEPTREAGEEKEEAEPAPVIKPTTQPIRPIRKAAPTVTGLSDDLSWAEWTKRRQAQRARK